MDRPFQLEEKNDLIGRTISVRIPESDVDIKAVKTMRTDMPGFCVPFQYKLVNGYLELTYQLGTLNKLTHFLGNQTPDNYIGMWLDVVSPLILCGDWFLRYDCFLMDLNYIYYQNTPGPHAVKYIYIPSVQPCADATTLKSFVETISQRNTTTNNDMVLDVFRSIQNFNAFDFVQMLKTHQTAKEPVAAVSHAYAPPVNAAPPPAPAPMPAAAPPRPAPVMHTPAPVPAAPAVNLQQPMTAAPASAIPSMDNIIIQPLQQGKPEKIKKQKEPKPEKPQKEKKPFLFGKKKEAPEIIMAGAAGNSGMDFPNVPAPAPVHQPMPYHDSDDGVTVVIRSGGASQSTPSLKLVGQGNFKKMIPLAMQVGQTFTIGRFDSSIGMAQSDFEFDKNSPEISRRHAVIELTQNGYEVTDLKSKAGTYINHMRLTPGTPHILNANDTVSFGNAGADYRLELPYSN